MSETLKLTAVANAAVSVVAMWREYADMRKLGAQARALVRAVDALSEAPPRRPAERASLCIEDGGHVHRLTVRADGALEYTRSMSEVDRVAVHSLYFRREDWSGPGGALENYAKRFPVMVKAFAAPSSVPERCSCCPRADEYNGFRSGARLFDCPKGCGCHD